MEVDDGEVSGEFRGDLVRQRCCVEVHPEVRLTLNLMISYL